MIHSDCSGVMFSCGELYLRLTINFRYGDWIQGCRGYQCVMGSRLVVLSYEKARISFKVQFARMSSKSSRPRC
jgi:hypothetical protein